MKGGYNVVAVKGAILGDIIGSRFEMNQCENPKTCRLFAKSCRFTDDTVLTLAVKDYIMNPYNFHSVEDSILYHAFNHPYAGYGKSFTEWMWNGYQERPSVGNGAAMRISSISDIDIPVSTAIGLVKEVTIPTHNTESAIEGATVIAVCGILARRGKSKQQILDYASIAYPEIGEKRFDELNYGWSSICRMSVPLAVRCFIDSYDFESCMRNVLSVYCDADTVCAMAGGIAENFYGETLKGADKYLDQYLTDDLKRILYAN